MSFTVIRHKNGKTAPVTLSIWDAFKGVPAPKPRKSKPCSCCHKIHPKKHQEGGHAQSREPKDSKTEISLSNNNQATQPSRSTRDREIYSNEDDIKIIEMKAGHKSWKEILTAINKESQSQLKEHWKTIDPARHVTQPSKDNQKSSQELDDQKKAEIERKKAEGQAKKSAKERRDEQNKQSTTANEHAMPAGGGANDLNYFANRYDRHKWVAAASKHFDLTGERITAATARKMAEGI